MRVQSFPRARTRKQAIAWAGRQDAKHLSVVQSEALDSVYPNWRKNFTDVWFRNLAQAEAFVAEHGRMPSNSAKDTAEAAIGRWVVAQRSNPRLAPVRKQALKDRLPRALMSRDDVWMERLLEVVAFHRATGRLPVVSAADAGEKSLGFWLHNVRSTEQSAGRISALDTLLPGWRKSPDEIWTERVGQVASFMRDHGRMPVAGAKDDHERKLATWVRNLSTRKTPLTSAQLAELNSRIPGWNRTIEDVWKDRLEEVRAFIVDHRRFPLRSTSASLEEAGNARWLYDQRRKKIKPSRKAILDDRIPGWQEATPGMAVELSAHMG